jgi:DNA-binding response OmpR family regulator
MKILVVEDQKKIRDYLKDKLQPDYFEVDTASDGKKGLELIKMNDYDLVILDNILPEKHGIDVCIEAREFGVETPILILSVLSSTKQKAELLNAGADDYLAKPFSFNELQARIQALLRRPKKIQEEVLQVGKLTLNVSTNIVTLDGEECNLTRKEFMLLRYFMKNPNIVLSRSMIINHVWDMDTDPFSNTIEAHIVSLRRKLGDSKQGIIKTFSGRGYKLVDR